MLVADESSTTLQVWDDEQPGGASVQLQLQYLLPLVKGAGYYEAAGYYHIPHSQFYFEHKHAPQHDYAPERVAAARQSASARLAAFDGLRCAPFAGGALCRSS